MLKAVLLDLDNTLLIYDEPAYYRRYFRALAPHFEDLFAREELIGRLMAATAALQTNPKRAINLDHFLKAFGDSTPLSRKELWERFMVFYRRDYGRFGLSVAAPQGLEAVLCMLKAAGLKLIIATNPMFPLIALEKRMHWVDLNKDDFVLVTHMENMRYVKPHAGYYLSICKKIAEKPANCIMVGNDLTNDMAAGGAGLITYHTTDVDKIDYSSIRISNLDRPAPPKVPPPDYSGPFAALTEIICKLS
jgi:putative hydrolase of the HAD superfamily